MSHSRFQRPACCDQADAIWMPKGAKIPNEHQRRGGSRPVRPGVQYGPEREGWCVYYESGGCGPSVHVNVNYCQFCGRKLDATVPGR